MRVNWIWNERWFCTCLNYLSIVLCLMNASLSNQWMWQPDRLPADTQLLVVDTWTWITRIIRIILSLVLYSQTIWCIPNFSLLMVAELNIKSKNALPIYNHTLATILVEYSSAVSDISFLTLFYNHLRWIWGQILYLPGL